MAPPGFRAKMEQKDRQSVTADRRTWYGNCDMISIHSRRVHPFMTHPFLRSVPRCAMLYDSSM